VTVLPVQQPAFNDGFHGNGVHVANPANSCYDLPYRRQAQRRPGKRSATRQKSPVALTLTGPTRVAETNERVVATTRQKSPVALTLTGPTRVTETNELDRLKARWR